MDNEEMRAAALAYSLQVLGNISDFDKVFETADLFFNYMSGQQDRKLFTEAEALEYIGLVDDPQRFSNHVKIRTHDKGLVCYRPNYRQYHLIDHIHQNRLSIVSHPRQKGVTTAICFYALWWALFKENQTVVMMSPKFRNSVVKMERIVDMVASLPDRLRPKIVMKTDKMLVFDNGSQINLMTSSETIVGRGINLFTIDDAEFISHQRSFQINDEIAPLLANGTSKIVINSTHFSTDSMFYCFWVVANSGVSGQDSFAPLQIT